MTDFPSTQFSMTKSDNSSSFATGGIINRRTHHNSLCRNKNKHQMTSYVIVDKTVSHVTLPRMRELSPGSYLSCLK
jgi:hypothetical protein